MAQQVVDDAFATVGSLWPANLRQLRYAGDGLLRSAAYTTPLARAKRPRIRLPAVLAATVTKVLLLAPMTTSITYGESGPPQTVREQIRVAHKVARNQAFDELLRRHGQSCAVSESTFSGTLKTPKVAGDLWSVRCAQGHAFAVLIENDQASTAWFMPCERVERISPRRCFGPVETMETLR